MQIEARMIGDAHILAGCVVYLGMQTERRAGTHQRDRNRQHDTVLVADGLQSTDRWQAARRRPGDLGTSKVL
jgi:hypothetical protein